jgi:hypothetical protein
MQLHESVAGVQSKTDLAGFVQALALDFLAHQHEWENITLERYLEALARWLADSDAYYKNQGLDVPSTPSWKNVAEMLIAAKSYE